MLLPTFLMGMFVSLGRYVEDHYWFNVSDKDGKVLEELSVPRSIFSK